MTTEKQLLRGPFRADQVGSLLRPEKIKQARADYSKGKITKDDLRKIENEAIKTIVEKQKAIGLTAVTDGEFRREYWHLDFIQSLSGIKVYEEETPGFFQGQMAKLKKYVVNDGLHFPQDHPFLEDYKFLHSMAGDDHVAKITIPGPNMIFHSGVIANEFYLNDPIYDSLDAVGDAIANVYQDAIQAFYDAGCRYLQLDDTSWGALFSDEHRKNIEKHGFAGAEIVKRFADITIQSLKNKPEDMTVTIHICRGNFKSSWLYEGDYEPIAKDLFERVNVDGFFLEFDSDRAGSFEPLRFIKNQKVVLGLVTTKTAPLEDPTIIKQRIKEASKYVDIDQLCLSPQCGFASTEEGNLMTEEDQWAKLKLVVNTANDVWS
ncbi:MAG TPA: 5-methyltetrahydropteroyltriglutamate--homocysteine S-methyltransferase [Bacillota bacterium]|nr:5-methyltetrahydropteroyltriglutamate--homocysteine S-methyltransferase [Bacillota bacterium]